MTLVVDDGEFRKCRIHLKKVYCRIVGFDLCARENRPGTRKRTEILDQLASLFDCSSYRVLINTRDEEIKQRIKNMAGPHSYALLKALMAQKSNSTHI